MQDTLGFWDGETLRASAVLKFLRVKKVDLAHRVSLRDQFTQMARLCNQVAAHFGGHQPTTALWFRLKNPMLGDISPRDMIRYGRFDTLRRLVTDALAENEQTV